jgi:hypothetical protein
MIYYEILFNDSDTKEYYYHEVSGFINGARGLGHMKLATFANRIWREELDKVRIVKDRMNGLQDQECDLREFLWVKLSAKPSSIWR